MLTILPGAGDAKALKESKRGVQVSNGTLRRLIRQELGKGEAGMIVDGNMEIFLGRTA